MIDLRSLCSLQEVVSSLQKQGLCKRVLQPVDIRHEMAGIAKKLESSTALLFPQIQHYPNVQLFTGLYWNRDLLAGLFGVSAKELPFFLASAIRKWKENPISPITVSQAPANEVVRLADTNEDLLAGIPIPTHGLLEGGPYLDSCVLIAKDPETGVRNASIQRLMKAGANRLTLQLDEGRHLRDYYERAEKMGRPLEVTINNGVSPAIHFAAVAPSNAAPIEMDELGIASQLLGEPLRLLQSQTISVEGVADAQYILEGEMIPEIREPEGPFPEVTGYYAERADRWVIRVKAVTHRAKPIFHTIIPGIEVYNAVGLMAEAAIYGRVSREVPDLREVFLSYGGAGFYHANLQISKTDPESPHRAILATFAEFPSLRRVTVVDEDVNIHDPYDVEWAIATRHDPIRDMIVLADQPGHELNPMTVGGKTAKVGIDATAPSPRSYAFQRFQVFDVDLKDFNIK